MRLANFFRAFVLLMPLLLFDTVFAADDYVPEVTARVARISFLRGDVLIKRADSDDWERASLNLPIVEGDQIATELNARLEIQFDRDSFLRLAENSYLKITTLRDEGVALSLPQGTLSLRVLNFDKSLRYFEIDAPQTTVSVQKTGMYRIDAGDKDSTQVRVTATDGAEARVYSENSGFTLRSGRSATIYLDGTNAGEWQMADASRYSDEWDNWIHERDEKIAKLLRDAYYDKYYDRDMYGAEDLNDYGEWVFSRKYGWVWRPYRNSTAGYADWSPYRYGQWRWIPPYGWTWVNDEPWGWATYHHGRWVYDDGEWCWTPYASYRPRRSWWHPALVVVTWSGNLICWYPLPYDYGYYNYNSYYHRRRRNNGNTTIINNNTTVVVNPTPNPTPGAIPVPLPGKGPKLPPFQTIPASGVVTIAKEQFGTQIKGAKTAPLDVAKMVLAKEPDVIKQAPELPVGIVKTTAVKNEIIVEKSRVKSEPIAKTGVVERKIGVPMDEEIRQKKVFEERKPVNRQRDLSGGEQVKSTIDGGNTEIRKTGAVERPPVRPVVRQDDNNTDKTPPTDTPVRQPRDKPRDDQPIVKPRRDENQVPVYVPPPPREEPRERPQPQEPVRQEPRNERPREEPKSEPKPEPKSEPKPESKPESKPQPPSEVKGNKNGKDGLN